jgi:sulfur-oxidizing protein SoxB
VEGTPVWDIFAKWLRSKKTVSANPRDLPVLTKNMTGNPGIAFPKEYDL